MQALVGFPNSTLRATRVEQAHTHKEIAVLESKRRVQRSADNVNTPAAETPVPFDPDLVDQLRAEHDQLGARLATLAEHFARNLADAWCAVHDCAGALHELRCREALWLYPAVAGGLAHDPLAKRRFLCLRLLMNSLARRLSRRIEELARAVRQESDIRNAVAAANVALAEYRQRNERDIFPLYNLMDRRQAFLAAIG